MHAHTHTHTHTHAHTHTHTHTHMRTHTHTQIHACTHIHARTHTHTHTQSIKAKPKVTDQKIQQAEESYTHAKQLYDEITDQLYDELPTFYDRYLSLCLVQSHFDIVVQWVWLNIMICLQFVSFYCSDPLPDSTCQHTLVVVLL